MRKETWSTDLHDFIDQNKDRPFKWGEWDCCLFAADAIKLMTGNDLADDIRGSYKTKIGATRVIKKLGYSGVEELLDARLGNSKPRLNACRGDIALVQQENGPAAGVVYGAGIMAIADSGMTYVPLSAAKKVWSIE